MDGLRKRMGEKQASRGKKQSGTPGR